MRVRSLPAVPPCPGISSPLLPQRKRGVSLLTGGLAGPLFEYARNDLTPVSGELDARGGDPGRGLYPARSGGGPETEEI